MSVKSLNLAKKSDFLLATGSSVATIAALFGKNPEEWDILEASYNFVPFLVLTSKVDWGGALSSIRDSGGRRLAKFQFPYKDGQTTDDLGRSPESFDCDIVLFGDSYLNGMSKLFKELQSPEPGTLVHPIRGVVTCKMQNFEMIHSHDHRKAVQIKITFVEHNFDLASYGSVSFKKNFKNLLSDVMAVFNAIQGLKNKIQGAINLYNSIKTVLNDNIDAYNAAFTQTTININKVFNKGSTSDFPSLLPANQGGVLDSSGNILGTTQTSTTSNDDPFKNIPVQQIQAQIAANQALLATQQYENTGLLEGITDANTSFQALANVSLALGSLIAENQINSCRDLATTLIKNLAKVKYNSSQFSTDDDSDGSIFFANEILDMKRSCILLQNAYEAGKRQTKIGVKKYIVPNNMSIRMIAFLNHIDANDCYEIDLLNPELETTNLVLKGTEVLVPTF